MKKYDQDFQQEVIRKFLAGQSVASLAREFGVAESAIHRWKKELLVPQAPGTESHTELLALRKRLLELELENQILKKGGTYLRQRQNAPPAPAAVAATARVKACFTAHRLSLRSAADSCEGGVEPAPGAAHHASRGVASDCPQAVCAAHHRLAARRSC